MCGIVGFHGPGGLDDLHRMMATLRHRGPDDAGTHQAGPLHLGHQRLSIIDLSEQGRQPMSNEDGTIWLVFNGEIYNFQELRPRLEEEGHRFRSRTDSEVIIHLYESLGTEAFSRLNGMFALALWDDRRGRLVLARDRMGQKPLYFKASPGLFAFASEAEALLQHPGIKRELNLPSLAKFLFYEHVPTPECIWQGLKKLPPASWLEFDPASGETTVRRFWRVGFLPRHPAPEADLGRDLEERITGSLRRHLVADVPVGLFLSGGLDSSTLAYYAQKVLEGRLQTYTIAFAEPSFGEQDQARETSRLLGTAHEEIPFSYDDFRATALDLIPRLDEPFADSSLIPAFHLCRMVRPRIKVAIGGEGGDELLLGYPWFRAYEISRLIRAIPKAIRRHLLVPLVEGIPCSHRNETWEYRVKKFFEADEWMDNPFYVQQIWLGSFGPARLLRLFKPEYYEHLGLDGLFAPIDYFRQDAEPGETVFDGLVRQTQHKYLMDDGLTKTDRASMLASLEMRAPLLDADLVEWVNHLPHGHKFRLGKTKLLLRRLMAGKLPESVLRGRKRGFTPPISRWFCDEMRNLVREIIFAPSPYFQEPYVRQLWEEHTNHRQNHRKILWTLFIWQLWSGHHQTG